MPNKAINSIIVKVSYMIKKPILAIMAIVIIITVTIILTLVISPKLKETEIFPTAPTTLQARNFSRIKTLYTTTESYTEAEKILLRIHMDNAMQHLIKTTNFRNCPKQIIAEYVKMPECMCKGMRDETYCMNTITTDYEQLIVFYKLNDKSNTCVSGLYDTPEEREKSRQATTLASELNLENENDFIEAITHETGHYMGLNDEYCYNPTGNNPVDYEKGDCKLDPSNVYCERFYNPPSTCYANSIMGFLYRGSPPQNWSASAQIYLDRVIKCP